MSRGPGLFQQRIIEDLCQKHGIVAWKVLKERYPRQVANKSFFRAMRSLKQLGRVAYRDVAGQTFVCLAPVYRGAGGRPRFVSQQDQELIVLCNEAHRRLALVSKALDLPILPPGEALTTEKVDAYRRSRR